MKKIISFISILALVFTILFSTNIYAVALDNVNVETSKQLIHPGESVKVDIEFGKDLGSYTFDVAYDNQLFEYVSNEGGTADDNGTRVRVSFYDTTGGSSPRTNTSVTFKAKDVNASNPTDFSITANGLANPDASISYDDITTPIIKSVTVEPDYKDYNIQLKFTGEVVKNVKKDMNLVISSSMGKNYEHTRIIAEVVAPSGGDVKLVGTDSQNLEHDIIQSGWGDPNGDPIGGKNVIKELKLNGLFSVAGDYKITFKLIDRDDSDKEIAKKTVNIIVKEKAGINKPNTNQNTKPNQSTTNQNNKPSKMPQTGNTAYVYIVPAILILATLYVVLKKKN